MEYVEKKDSKWLIRAASPKDLPFIYATWLKSYWVDGDHPGMPKDLFFNCYARILDSLMIGSEMLVSCLPESPDTVLGYACFDEKYLHYIFVKEDFRMFKVATDLYYAANEPKQYTHKTKYISDFKKKDELTYKPLLDLMLQLLERKGEL